MALFLSPPLVDRRVAGHDDCWPPELVSRNVECQAVQFEPSVAAETLAIVVIEHPAHVVGNDAKASVQVECKKFGAVTAGAPRIVVDIDLLPVDAIDSVKRSLQLRGCITQLFVSGAVHRNPLSCSDSPLDGDQIGQLRCYFGHAVFGRAETIARREHGADITERVEVRAVHNGNYLPLLQKH